MTGVGKTTIWGNVLCETINPTRAPWYFWASHFLQAGADVKICCRPEEELNSYLNGGDATERPEVTVADPREFCLDFLHQVAGDVKTGVGAVNRFGLEAHSGVVAISRIESDVQHPEAIGERNRYLPPVPVSLS